MKDHKFWKLKMVLVWNKLYSYIIPISMYVSIEIQKFIGSKFVAWDMELTDDTYKNPPIVRTSDINEELGMDYSTSNYALVQKNSRCQKLNFLNFLLLGKYDGSKISPQLFNRSISLNTVSKMIVKSLVKSTMEMGSI